MFDVERNTFITLVRRQGYTQWELIRGHLHILYTTVSASLTVCRVQHPARKTSDCLLFWFFSLIYLLLTVEPCTLMSGRSPVCLPRKPWWSQTGCYLFNTNINLMVPEVRPQWLPCSLFTFKNTAIVSRWFIGSSVSYAKSYRTHYL